MQYNTTLLSSVQYRLPSTSFIAQTDTYNNQTYGQTVYGESDYNGGQSSGSGFSPKDLLNTGTIASFIIVIAFISILAAFVIKIWKRPRKKTKDNK